VQGFFHNWTSRFAWIFENGGEYIIESTLNGFLACNESQKSDGGVNFHWNLYLFEK
jgi:hypothetical protein